MNRGLEPIAGVYFLPRHRSYYGGFGHVRSTINGLNFLNKRGIDYDYVSLLTGQDYPIKSSAEISAFLENNRGRSFIEHFTMPASSWTDGGMIRITHLWFHSTGKVRNSPRDRFPLLFQQKIPYGLAPWGGSGYWTLYKEHADYVMRFVRSHPKYPRSSGAVTSRMRSSSRRSSSTLPTRRISSTMISDTSTGRIRKSRRKFSGWTTGEAGGVR